jgi:hypothetical protein
VADLVLQLFEEYGDRYAAGERPDLREFLNRAGEGRDELAGLVSRFLQWADAPEPDDDTIVLAQAWIKGEAPLVALRVWRGLRREQVVDWLLKTFAFSPKLEERVAFRYHQLETGQLEVRQADPRLVSGLGELLHARVTDLLAWKPRAVAGQAAYFRTEAALKVEMLQAFPPAMAAPSELDEVDRLFLGHRQ